MYMWKPQSLEIARSTLIAKHRVECSLRYVRTQEKTVLWAQTTTSLPPV